VIIMKTMAGLGNQLFQYACGRALALRRGTELRLWKDPVSAVPLTDQPDRPYRIFDFNIVAQPATELDLTVMQYKVHENPQTFLPAVLDLPDNVMLDGFWQTEKYFEDVASTIRSELEFKDPQRMQVARAKVKRIRQSGRASVVAVHVRRGDYVLDKTKGIFHNLSLQWFEMAMSRFPTQVVFLIFSDDITWCKEHLKGSCILYSTGNNDLEDLALMRACDGYVISNSSFSWWGAWLSDSPAPAVIGPDSNHWFGQVLMRHGQHDATHILPDRWLKQPD
jgi:hypothetical protein